MVTVWKSGRNPPEDRLSLLPLGGVSKMRSFGTLMATVNSSLTDRRKGKSGIIQQCNIVFKIQVLQFAILYPSHSSAFKFQLLLSSLPRPPQQQQISGLNRSWQDLSF